MAGADRMSLLPQEIKISILSRLNIRDAVRTSALARSWRHLWTFRSSLRLKYDEEEGRLWDTTDFSTVSVTSDWMELVTHLVSSLRSPLLVFRLYRRERIPFSNDGDPLLFQSFLDLLLRKGSLEELGLCLHYFAMPINLPPFHSLRQPTLKGCLVVLPPGFRGFNHLAQLNLIEVDISSADLDLLLCTSINLTNLKVLDSMASEHSLSVNLSLPLLRRLRFDINTSFEGVSVTSAPCLEQADISLASFDASSKLAQMTLRLVTGVVTVSSLCLYSDVLKVNLIYFLLL